ncbi:hypothetical protein SLS60_004256 [Paraconiothyrium brasiliense]|uniref:Piwi domain-containing protein n=1 Tax=Paraconiothyrium brasiliense TaxID=300254 RepID=A0ABR3RR57_9PLEO
MAATHTSALEEWDNPGHEFYYPKSTAPTLSPSNISADHGRAWKPHKDLFNMGITGTKNSQFPLRMNFMQGHPVKTYLTNHFEINITAKQLWEYEILDLDKGGHTRRKVRQLFNKAISTWPFLNENSGSFATDSVNTIISWVPLHHKISPGVHVEHKGDESAQIDDTSVVWSPMNVQDGKNGQDPIWARFRLVGKVDIAKLTSKSRSEARSEPESVGRDISHIERCLNIVISKSLTPEVVRLSGKKFYVRAGRSELLGTRGVSASLEIIRGYYFAVKPGMGNLFMNFNIATSAFFRPILVSEFLNDDDTFSGFESRFDILKRLRVFVEYPRKTLNSAKPNEYPDPFDGAPARIKNITEKSFDDIEKLTFRKKKQDDQGNFRKDAAGNFMFENKDTHVYKHLEEVFGKKVQPGRKAINVGSETNKIWYAQEHLRIIPYQIYTRPVPDHLTGSMVNTAARDPNVARTLIENEGLSKLGISQVGDSKVSFVKYDSASTKDKPIGQSGWNLRADHKFWPNKEVTTIKYYLIHGTSMANTKLGMSDVEKYEEAFRAQVCSRLSIPVANLRKVSHENTQIGNIENLTTDELDKEMKEKFRAAEDACADLMLLIIPAFNREIYRVYKNLADRVYSMRSICLTIKQDNLGKSQNMSKYMTNVAMKVNFKLGGVNTVVQELKNFGNDTLILGADVVHPGTAAFEGCPSIASIVGSLDQSATKYLGSMRLQSKPKMDREVLEKE